MKKSFETCRRLKLKAISEKLSLRDLERIQYLLGNVVPRNELISVENLFTKLDQRSLRNYNFVVYLLERIARKDLVEEAKVLAGSESTDVGRYSDLISQQRQQLIQLTFSLTDEDLRKMKFLCEDTIPLGTMETISTPIQLFTSLEHNLGKDFNKDFLNDLLDKIPRKDLKTVLEVSPSAETKTSDSYGLRLLPADYIERNEAVEDLKRLLDSGQSYVGVVGTRGCDVVGIKGMGGIGKTVLAQAVCWQIKKQRQVIWLTIGQSPELLVLLNTLAGAISGENKAFTDKVKAQNWILENTKDKNCLVVLDDVWDVNHASVFDIMSGKCQLLITTRDSDVVRGLRGSQLYELGFLNRKEARSFLCGILQKNFETLNQEVRLLIDDILDQCGGKTTADHDYRGLPLAIALVGSCLVKELSFSAWRDVLDDLREADLEQIKSYFPKDSYPYEHLMAAIDVSFNALDAGMKEKYLRFAVFAEDTEIPNHVLQMLWGDSSTNGRETRGVLTSFVTRSLIQRGTEDSCFIVHDILLDYVRGRLKKQRGSNALKDCHNNLLQRYSKKCSQDKWSTGPKDDKYFFQHLAYHLHSAGQVEALIDELTNFEWLAVKLQQTNLASLLHDFSFVDVEDKSVRQIHSCLLVSSNVIGTKPDHLGGQLLGRLSGLEVGDKVVKLLNQVRKKQLKENCILPLNCCLTPPGGPLLQTTDARSRTVLAIVVTPDLKHIITGGSSAIKIWEFASGKELRTLNGHTKMVYALALSPSGRVLVSGSFDFTVKLWNLELMEEVITLKGHTDWVSGVVITQDGTRVISSSYDSTIKIWDLESGSLVSTLKGHQGHVRGLALTPDGSSLISGSQDSTVKLWSLQCCEVVKTFRGHSRTVYTVCPTPDGRCFVSGSDDHLVKIWDIENGEEVRSLIGHTGEVYSVAVTPDGQRVLSCGEDSSVRIWSFHTGEQLSALRGHSESVRVVMVTKDGDVAISGSEDCTFKLWDLNCCQEMPQFAEHKMAVNACAITGNGDISITASDDHSLKVWRGKYSTELKEFVGHSDPVLSLAFHPKDNAVASGDVAGVIRLWSIKENTETGVLDGHKFAVEAVSFNQSGDLLASGSKDNIIKVWNWSRLVCQSTIAMPVFGFIDLAFDGNLLLACTANNVYVKCSLTAETAVISSDELDDGNCDIRSFENVLPGTEGVDTRITNDTGDRSVAFCRGPDSRSFPAVIMPDGSAVLRGCTNKSSLRFWQIETNLDIGYYFCNRTAESLVTAISLTPCGNEAVLGCDNGIITRLNLQTGEVLQVYKSRSEGASAVTVLQDGSGFVVGYCRGDLEVWEMHDEDAVLHLCSLGKKVICARVTSEKRMAVVTDDGTLFTLGTTLEDRVRMPKQVGLLPVTTINTSESGNLLVVGCKDGKIILFTVHCRHEDAPSLDKTWVTEHAYEHEVTAVAFGPGDKSLVSGSRDNVVKHWDVSSGAKLAEFRCMSFGANCLSLTDKRLVACFNDCTAVVWSIESGEVEMVNTAHGGRYHVAKIVLLAGNVEIFSSGFQNTLKKWSLETGYSQREEVTYKGHGDEITALALVPGYPFVLTGSRDKTLKLWSVDGSTPVGEFCFEQMVSALSCSTDGLLCVGLSNGQVCFMEVNLTTTEDKDAPVR